MDPEAEHVQEQRPFFFHDQEEKQKKGKKKKKKKPVQAPFFTLSRSVFH